MRTGPLGLSRIIAVLLGLHLALKLSLLPIALRTPLQGDEVTYDASARSLARAVRSLLSGGGLPVADLQEHVVGFGWFMPGMSALVAPLYVVDPNAGTHAVRIYVGLLTSALFCAAVWLVHRALPWPFAVTLAVVPGLVPFWVLYSYTTWGDLSAGIILVLAVVVLVGQWGRLSDGKGVRLRSAVLLGLLLGAALYLRSSTLPLVAGLLALSAVAVVCRLRGRAMIRSLGACVLASLIFGATLAPWSIAASRTFDTRVVTTTTVPISMAYAFGDRDDLCLGPCPDGNIWYSMVRYSRSVAERTGESELNVQKRMSEHARRDVTPPSYARDVLGDFGRYTLQPTGFESVFRTVADTDLPSGLRQIDAGVVSHLSTATTWIMYFAALVVAAVVLLVPRRIPAASQVVLLLASVVTASLMTQPFVHVCTPRYWPIFIPIIALAAAAGLVRSDPERHSKWLRRLQVVVAAGWVATLLGLVVVGSV